MRQIFLIISIFLLLGIATDVNPAIADEDVKIGSELNPKILSVFPMPKEFASAGSLAINGDYLWTTGTEFITDSEGKGSFKTKIAIFDISIPSKPKLLVIHDASDAARHIGFFNQYAYLIYNTKFKQKSAEEKKKTARYGLMVCDVSNPMNPIVVNNIEEVFLEFPNLCIDEHSKIMYIFASSVSGLKNQRAIDRTQIYRFSLEDPKKPKIISSKIIGTNGEETSFIDDYVQDVKIRDNFLYVLTLKKIYLFDASGKDLRLINENEGIFSSFEACCLAEDYLSKDRTYVFASGRNRRFEYPGEETKSRGFPYQNGIALFANNTNIYPPIDYIGETSSGVRIPFTPNIMHSKGTLIYVCGYQSEDDRVHRSNSTGKLLIVDFSNLSDIKFSGSMDFDGAIMDCIIRDCGDKTIAYLMVFKQEGMELDSKAKSTLYALELPVKEGVFQRQHMSMEEMYPGYIEPEIKPNPLETALRDLIDKSTGQLTIADFKDVKALDLEGKKLTDLNGIELCTDLEELKLGANHIDDIAQLANLGNLRILDLKSNDFNNIEPLKNLSNLEELNLYSNEIEDISPLLSLPKLKKLNLGSNKISDFIPLSQLTGLTELKLAYNNIFRPPSLAGLKELKVLNLTSNSIYYMDFIADLPPNLEELNLYGNNVKDVSSLARLSGLKKLVLQNNNLNDIAPLKNLTSLEELDLSDNKKIQDFTPLANLTNLKKLRLSELDQKDIRFLENLTNIENLDLTNHMTTSPKKISDLNPLAGLKNLKVLNVGNNEVEDLKPLKNLSEIVELYLRRNKIQNLDILRNFSKLEKLDLSENKIKDISPLSNLEKLKEVILTKNEIKDVTALLEGKISPDCSITIGGNQIPAEQLKELRREFIIFPDENESYALGNLVVTASCEINFQKDKGRYTKDIKELVTSGFLMHRGDLETLTIDSIIYRYDVALFDVNDKGFTILITPKKDIQGRTFAITQEGVVIEWLGDEKPDLTKINFDDNSLWKKWPKESQFSVYSCGTGG